MTVDNTMPVVAACTIRLGAIELLVLAGEKALSRIFLLPDAQLRARFGKLSAGGNLPIAHARDFLGAYMRREKADIPPLDLSGFSDNEKRIYRELLRVPSGETITYGELAHRAGFPGAARFAGSCMRKNNFPIIIPCHRVIPASGGIGNYSPDPSIKRMLLGFEQGATILPN